MLVGPHADGFEHVSMDFDVFIAKSWVVEGADDVVDDFVDGDVGVFPGEEDAAIWLLVGGKLMMESVSLRDGVLENRRGNSASARI